MESITPKNSNQIQGSETNQTQEENDTTSDQSKEITVQSLDNETPSTTEPPKPFCLSQTLSFLNDHSYSQNISTSMPLIVVGRPPSNRSAVITQPLRDISILPSAMSMNMPLPNQPQSLFLQALSKVNESSLSLAYLSHLRKYNYNLTKENKNVPKENLSAPDSLISAPPSYSYVLRQAAARRRPRLMGTFIPSPSFVQHTPPPNYAAAFDIYVDNALPPPPARISFFGFTSMPAPCPECGYTGMTVVTARVTLCTHLCALILCLFCCWICAPLPYMLRSCKDVYHYCRNCRSFLGMYSPTNPETVYP